MEIQQTNKNNSFGYQTIITTSKEGDQAIITSEGLQYFTLTSQDGVVIMHKLLKDKYRGLIERYDSINTSGINHLIEPNKVYAKVEQDKKGYGIEFLLLKKVTGNNNLIETRKIDEFINKPSQIKTDINGLIEYFLRSENESLKYVISNQYGIIYVSGEECKFRKDEFDQSLSSDKEFVSIVIRDGDIVATTFEINRDGQNEFTINQNEYKITKKQFNIEQSIMFGIQSTNNPFQKTKSM